MKRFFKLAIFSLIILTPLFSNLKTVNALSCIEFQGYKNALETADWVFQGTVIDVVSDSNGGEIYTFQVSLLWKGGSDSIVQLHQTATEIGWSYTFVEGNEYIIFANFDEAGNLQLPLCGTSINLSVNDSGEYDILVSEIGEPKVVEPGTKDIDSDKGEEKEMTSKILVGTVFFIPLVIALSTLGFILYKKDRR